MANNKHKNQMNRSIIILISSMLFFCTSCKKQSFYQQDTKSIIDTNMDTINEDFSRKYDFKTGLEIYDFEIVKNSKTNPAVVKNNNWLIMIHSMLESGSCYDEYPPAPEFYIVQKMFYPNGMLKQKGAFFHGNLKIGLWQYYNEQGELIKEVDEDKKFGKSRMKVKDVLKFLEKEGWINLTTGEGATKIIVENNDVMIFQPPITIAYLEENNEPFWIVTAGTGRKYKLYRINGNSGKIEEKEEEINLIK